MNDFTKEELESIWNCVDLYTDHPHHPYQELLNKIQSMIDDYCDHGGACFARVCCGDGSELIGIKFCGKCQQILT